MAWSACFLVVLHGGAAAITKPVLEKPPDQQMTPLFLAHLVFRACGGVVMGIGIGVGMFAFTFVLHRSIFNI